MLRQWRVRHRLERAEKMLELRKSGKTLEEIGDLYGISAMAVHKQLVYYKEQRQSKWFGVSLPLRHTLERLGFVSLLECKRHCWLPRRMFIRAHGGGSRSLVELESLLRRKLPEVSRSIRWPTHCPKHGQLLEVSRDGLKCTDCGIIVSAEPYRKKK